MDIILVANLSAAGASLEAAMDAVESGSPFWSALSALRLKVEGLIEEEVRGEADYTPEDPK
jgi:hypothetical protein